MPQDLSGVGTADYQFVYKMLAISLHKEIIICDKYIFMEDISFIIILKQLHI